MEISNNQNIVFLHEPCNILSDENPKIDGDSFGKIKLGLTFNYSGFYTLKLKLRWESLFLT